MAQERLPRWLVTDRQTGASVEVDAATRVDAAFEGSRLLTEAAPATELDVLARDVLVMRLPPHVTRAVSPCWPAEAATA